MWPLVAYFGLIASSSSACARGTGPRTARPGWRRPSPRRWPCGPRRGPARGAVGLGLLDRVAVDELAEDLVGALLVAHDDRRAGEADARAVGQPGQQVGVQVAGLVRWASSTSTRMASSSFSTSNFSPARAFVHRRLLQAFGQTRPGRARPRIAASRCFWIVANTSPAPCAAPVALHPRVRGHLHHVLAGQRGGFGELTLQVLAVGDHHHLEAAQRASVRILRTRNTMVRLLPEPWVCQMMPPRRSCSPSCAGSCRCAGDGWRGSRRGTAGSGRPT
jgi:hypothetical protein